jgi:hypothetical protein
MKKENVLRQQAEQLWIPLPLAIIRGNKDYNQHKDLLERIDQLLISSGIEANLQERALAKAEAAAMAETKQHQSASALMRIQKWTSQALRCNIVRVLSMESFRDLAFHLGDSPLLQRFCRLVDFNQVRVPSKSTLQEYSEAFEEVEIRELVKQLTLATQEKADGLGLASSLDLSTVLMDSTCVALDIHFPVDWVLLRDAVRTLTKAIECIRRHGLKCRIKAPSEFRTQMNRYSMALTQAKQGKLQMWRLGWFSSVSDAYKVLRISLPFRLKRIKR